MAGVFLVCFSWKIIILYHRILEPAAHNKLAAEHGALRLLPCRIADSIIKNEKFTKVSKLKICSW